MFGKINQLSKSFEIPTEELRGLLIQGSQVAFKVGSYIFGNHTPMITIA